MRIERIENGDIYVENIAKITKNAINSKEELLELLKNYKGILTNSIMDYLRSLIELEFSVVREYIKDDDRKALAELEIYKRVAVYNIYNKAIKLFSRFTTEQHYYEAYDDTVKFKVDVPLNKNSEDFIRVFDFTYEHFENVTDERFKEYKTTKIGTISLHQTLESKDLKEVLLNKVLEDLEHCYSAHNHRTLHRSTVKGKPIINGETACWDIYISHEIKSLEVEFTKIDGKKGLTDEEKREIEIRNQIHELLLEDYGLTAESFSENFYYDEPDPTSKVLVKKQAGISIEDRIDYKF